MAALSTRKSWQSIAMFYLFTSPINGCIGDILAINCILTRRTIALVNMRLCKSGKYFLDLWAILGVFQALLDIL